MIGEVLYPRKDRASNQSWPYIILIIIAIVMIIAIASQGREVPPAIFTVIVFGGIFLFQISAKKTKAVVLLKEDHLEINQGILTLVRYQDIQSVNRPQPGKLELLLQSKNGKTQTVKILLNDLEPLQVEKLVSFLSEQTSTT